MESKGTILIVDDNSDILFSLQLLLRGGLDEVITTTDPGEIPRLYKERQPDCVLLDMNFHQDKTDGEEGFYWLEYLRKTDPQAVVVMMTAFSDVENAVRSIKNGAMDFITKPWDNKKLLDTVLSCVNMGKARHEAIARERQRQSAAVALMGTSFIGQSECMKQVCDMVQRIAPTDANVLILGENGTGKEVVANMICKFSQRAEKPFVSIDMGSLPENLFESEIFGHEKGAFTDAHQSKAGRLETASGGTLFLDEIGNLSLTMQSKLLTALESKRVSRLGSTTVNNIDVRLICATNADLYEEVQNGRFRQDLLYRINTIEITLPPLRERGDDILLLADYFLSIFARKYKKEIKGISSEAQKKLLTYQWPGNVRELKHAIERAVVMCNQNAIISTDFPLEEEIHKRHTEVLNLGKLESQAISRAMEISKGNITEAAELLGITRYTLYRKIK
jgi:DNA-binding NtrC family response regulator